MEVYCVHADSKDLIDLRKVLNYMAFCEDTLYIPVMKWRFDTIYNSKVAFDSYIREITASNLRYLNDIGARYHFLRVGTFPNPNIPDLNVLQFETFYLGNGCVVGDLNWEYWEKCKNEAYMNLSDWNFDKENVREKDIDLYYNYTVASDNQILETRPQRIIPTDIRYDYSPNERVVRVRNGNVFIEPY